MNNLGTCTGRPKEDRSSAVDLPLLQNAASSAAILAIQGSAPDICVQISQNNWAALWSLASPFVQWQTETTAAMATALGVSLPLTEASPLVLDLELGIRCNLKAFTQGVEVRMEDRSRSVFQVDATVLRLFLASGVDGRVASSVSAVQANGLRVACGPNEFVLLTSAIAAGAELLHVQRQLTAGKLTTEAQAYVSVRGATISTAPGDLTFSWLQSLPNFFTLPAAEELGEEAAGQPPASLPASASCAWHLHLSDCALRDEPPTTENGSVAAALLVDNLEWVTPKHDSKQVVKMSNLSLLAAEASGRGEGFTSSDAVDLPASHLLSCGYVCLAQEGGFCLTVEPPEEGDGIEGESRTAKTELTNHRLHFALTKTSWLLLNRLVVRWSSAFESSGQQRSSDNFDIPDEVPGASRQGGSIAVFADVVDDAFSSKRSEQKAEKMTVPCYVDGEYFVPVPGGLVDAEDEESDVPGGAPVIIEDFFSPSYRHSRRTSSRSQSGSEEIGIWYECEEEGEGEVHPMELQEEYVKPPPPDYLPPSGQKCAVGPLPEGYAIPTSRFTIRDFKVVVALCQAAETGHGREGGSATTSRLELDLEGFGLQADTFPPDSQHARRLAISFKSADLKDCALKADASPAWQKVFTQYIGAQTLQGPSACVFTMELEAVRPDSGGGEELRLLVSSQPMRLRIDQDVVIFLQSFFTLEANDSPSESVAQEDSAVEETANVFFQRCEIKSLLLVVDYKPRRLDVAALRAGNLAEVLNVTAWSNVTVQLPHLRMGGLHGWQALGSMLTQRYLQDVTSSQVHNLIRGIKPIQSIIRISAAAGQLFAIPAEALRGRVDTSYGSQTIPISRQVQRGVFGLVRAIISETLGMSAGALGGIHLVLAGPSAATAAASASQPSNVTEGMRQAASRLSSGFGEMGAALRAPFSEAPRSPETLSGSNMGSATVRALRATPGALAKPLSGGAAAARCALLGAKNSLDPERYESKKLGR